MLVEEEILVVMAGLVVMAEVEGVVAMPMRMPVILALVAAAALVALD